MGCFEAGITYLCRDVDTDVITALASLGRRLRRTVGGPSDRGRRCGASLAGVVAVERHAGHAGLSRGSYELPQSSPCLVDFPLARAGRRRATGQRSANRRGQPACHLHPGRRQRHRFAHQAGPGGRCATGGHHFRATDPAGRLRHRLRRAQQHEPTRLGGSRHAVGLAHAQCLADQPARPRPGAHAAAGQRPPCGRLPTALRRRKQLLQLQQYSLRRGGAHRDPHRRRLGDLWLRCSGRRGQRDPQARLPGRPGAPARRHRHRGRPRQFRCVLGRWPHRRELEPDLRAAGDPARPTEWARPCTDGRFGRHVLFQLDRAKPPVRVQPVHRSEPGRCQHQRTPGAASGHLRALRGRIRRCLAAELQPEHRRAHQRR